MARVFIDTRELETAVAVREAVRQDDHEIEMVATGDELEARLPADPDEAIALILTGEPEDEVARRLAAPLASAIPRPPILAVRAEPEAERRHALAERADLDECLPAPPDEAEVQVTLAQQLDRYRLQRETGIVGRTEAIREVLERVHLFAPVHSTVLITGESGTGKELAARAIHRLSPRRGRAFIAMNCAAVPESLLESELFGHEKGAFTGATSRRRGMFELADGGTLLLDEIAEMPPPLQTRLLRVLESRRFMRVGGDTEIEVNVRVIAATNRDLREAVRTGDFRRDLYYRLNVLHLELPPLRERKPDIPVLVRRFVREFSEAHDREFKGLSPDAMEILLDYSWPGNVRELRNLIESMVVLAPGSVIEAEDIPPEIRARRGRGLLPIPVPPEGGEKGEAGEAGRLPQVEFIFRSLVEMKMDLEDLRGEFERFRMRYRRLGAGGGEEGPSPIEVRASDVPQADVPVPFEAAGDDGAPDAEEGAEARAENGVPVIRMGPDMTMADLEREAIVLALREVGGNRRKAAERLAIGERTLYRKLREYGIDA